MESTERPKQVMVEYMDPRGSSAVVDQLEGTRFRGSLDLCVKRPLPPTFSQRGQVANI